MTVPTSRQTQPMVPLYENSEMERFFFNALRAETRPVLRFMFGQAPLVYAADFIWSGAPALLLREYAEKRLWEKQLALEAATKTQAKLLKREILDLEAGILLLMSK